jgi:DNA repair exonuclease SbcCD ATPase subunit
MSIVFKNITLRNFLSVGAITQSVSLDTSELTLVLGENLDLGGAGARNGVGKTTMIQALSYALFGNPINSIRKDNLINRTNGKGMLVTLEYSANGIEYKIERSRKPHALKFYINNQLQDAKDDAQGENKDTQVVIERSIGMTHDMFKHIVVLNTYTEPFLALGAGQQRNIIEQLLGITLLSEKAEAIKTQMKSTKESIEQEEFKARTIQEANKRVEEQIENLRRRHRLWTAKHTEDLNKLAIEYDDLNKIDIDAELFAHKALTLYQEKKKKQDLCNSLLARQIAWKQKRDTDIKILQDSYTALKTIDIDSELQAHIDLIAYNQKKIELAAINKAIVTLESTLKKDENLVIKLEKEIETLEGNKCYTCGQDFHDDNHTAVIANKQATLVVARRELAQTQTDLEKNKNSVYVLGEIPVTHYKTQTEAIKHSSELENIQNQIDSKNSETDPYVEQINEHYTDEVLGAAPTTYYDTEAEAIEHRSTVANLLQQIQRKVEEVDPYIDQINDMEKSALQEINFDRINELTKIADHLKFLLDLLTSKDSFVRKKIIDQNLSYLNARLTHYLDKIGLPHTVVFKNDLTVEITELGRELDFYNLSRGEMNRLILALSFAFRDVWENLYFPINTVFIDELVDAGMDSIGLENSLAILKTMARNRNKSIWLVSHKEELISRVDRVLKVIKEGGFTSYCIDTD